MKTIESKYADQMTTIAKIILVISILAGGAIGCLIGGAIGNSISYWDDYTVVGSIIGILVGLVGWIIGYILSLRMLFLGELGRNVKIAAEESIVLANIISSKEQ